MEEPPLQETNPHSTNCIAITGVNDAPEPHRCTADCSKCPIGMALEEMKVNKHGDTLRIIDNRFKRRAQGLSALPTASSILLPLGIREQKAHETEQRLEICTKVNGHVEHFQKLIPGVLAHIEHDKNAAYRMSS